MINKEYVVLFERLVSHGVLCSLLAYLGVQTPLCANQPTTRSSFSDYVVTVSAGPAWTTAGHTQTFYLQPDIQNTYDATNKTTILGSSEIFLGVQRVLSEQLSGQLGVAAGGSGVAKLSGDIWQDADPDYNNFNYSYHVNQFSLTVKGTLIAEDTLIPMAVKPYLSGGLGVGFNRAYNYQANPSLFQAIAAPGFTDKTVTAFTYTIGAGIQKPVSAHWQVGLGYEFADWGHSVLGAAWGQTTESGLRLSHLYTNELQFSLSYLA